MIIKRSVFIEQHSSVNNFSINKSWSILSGIEERIKNKIEEAGVPLKDWDIQINYGIKTGLNEAFIISGEKKDELIAEDPKSAEIIRPILRGRDIKRYGYQFANMYLICTFPSRNYDIENFPAIKKHLLSFGYERLEQSGKDYIINGQEIFARKKTNNKWFETQDSISYWDEFYKQKLVWTPVNSEYRFTIIPAGMFFNNSIFMITGQGTHYLCGIMNSKIIRYYLSLLLAGDSYTYGSGNCFGNLQVPRIINALEIETLVKEIIVRKEQKLNTLILEHQIDACLFDFYHFTRDERNTINSCADIE